MAGSVIRSNQETGFGWGLADDEFFLHQLTAESGTLIWSGLRRSKRTMATALSMSVRAFHVEYSRLGALIRESPVWPDDD